MPPYLEQIRKYKDSIHDAMHNCHAYRNALEHILIASKAILDPIDYKDSASILQDLNEIYETVYGHYDYLCHLYSLSIKLEAKAERALEF